MEISDAVRSAASAEELDRIVAGATNCLRCGVVFSDAERRALSLIRGRGGIVGGGLSHPECLPSGIYEDGDSVNDQPNLNYQIFVRDTRPFVSLVFTLEVPRDIERGVQEAWLALGARELEGSFLDASPPLIDGMWLEVSRDSAAIVGTAATLGLLDHRELDMPSGVWVTFEALSDGMWQRSAKTEGEVWVIFAGRELDLRNGDSWESTLEAQRREGRVVSACLGVRE